MQACERCKIEYPAEILYSKICGICALEILNEHQVVKRTKFASESGEYIRHAAIAWRKRLGK